MPEVSANELRSHLESKVDEIGENHTVLRARRRRGGDFVVLSADDWSAIEETLHLNRVPGLVDSIHEAAAEPLDEGTSLEALGW